MHPPIDSACNLFDAMDNFVATNYVTDPMDNITHTMDYIDPVDYLNSTMYDVKWPLETVFESVENVFGTIDNVIHSAATFQAAVLEGIKRTHDIEPTSHEVESVSLSMEKTLPDIKCSSPDMETTSLDISVEQWLCTLDPHTPDIRHITSQTKNHAWSGQTLSVPTECQCCQMLKPAKAQPYTKCRNRKCNWEMLQPQGMTGGGRRKRQKGIDAKAIQVASESDGDSFIEVHGLGGGAIGVSALATPAPSLNGNGKRDRED